MLVFSEKLIRFGSCVVMMRSMWKRSARKRRSALPNAPMHAVTGATLAKTPRSDRRSWSASGVKNVLMLLVVMTRAALGSVCSNRFRMSDLVQLHAFNRFGPEFASAFSVFRERRIHDYDVQAP